MTQNVGLVTKLFSVGKNKNMITVQIDQVLHISRSVC